MELLKRKIDTKTLGGMASSTPSPISSLPLFPRFPFETLSEGTTLIISVSSFCFRPNSLGVFHYICIRTKIYKKLAKMI